MQCKLQFHPQWQSNFGCTAKIQLARTSQLKFHLCSEFTTSSNKSGPTTSLPYYHLHSASGLLFTIPQSAMPAEMQGAISAAMIARSKPPVATPEAPKTATQAAAPNKQFWYLYGIPHQNGYKIGSNPSRTSDKKKEPIYLISFGGKIQESEKRMMLWIL